MSSDVNRGAASGVANAGDLTVVREIGYKCIDISDGRSQQLIKALPKMLTFHAHHPLIF